MTFNYSSEDIEDIILKLNPVGSYILDLEKRIQRLEADLKRREDIDNAPAKYDD